MRRGICHVEARAHSQLFAICSYLWQTYHSELQPLSELIQKLLSFLMRNACRARSCAPLSVGTQFLSKSPALLGELYLHDLVTRYFILSKNGEDFIVHVSACCNGQISCKLIAFSKIDCFPIFLLSLSVESWHSCSYIFCFRIKRAKKTPPCLRFHPYWRCLDLRTTRLD